MRSYMIRYFSLLFLFALLGGCSDPVKSDVHRDAHVYTLPTYPLSKNVDSLKLLLNGDLHDTSRLTVLFAISSQLLNTSSDSVITVFNSQVSIAENLIASSDDSLKRIGYMAKATALGGLGLYYDHISDYVRSMELQRKALAINKQINDSLGMLKRLNNISTLYFVLNDLSKSLSTAFEALAISEKLNDPKQIQLVLGNIGNTYSSETEHNKALEYYTKALHITERTKDSVGMSYHLGNMGNAYHELFKLAPIRSPLADSLQRLSISFHEKSLAIRLRSKNRKMIANAYAGLGNDYKSMAEVPGITDAARKEAIASAKSYHTKALEIRMKLNSPEMILSSMGSLGSISSLEGNYKIAFDQVFRCMKIADSLHMISAKMRTYTVLSDLYAVSNIALPDTIGGKLLSPVQMREQALVFYKRNIAIRDTLFSQDNKKQLVRKEMTYEFDKKEAVTKAENDKKEALTKEALYQKEKERNYFIGGFVLVLLMSGFIFRGYRQKQKANGIISHQKAMVEEKQKEILDSIHYAKRIQKSLLPTEKYISKILDKNRNG